ncbi:MAG: penicillin-binding protein 2 [Ruminococcus flavefaciens]|nr:penicillin-binding protein 2 [Ruminococcus flavefaciens]MCM1229711.1 penicillin-binding protein 2 [Ruminococcus flavefaciens]
MRRRGENRVIVIVAVFFMMFFGLSLNYFTISNKREYVTTAKENSFITISAGDSQGTIFDRNFTPLTNCGTKIIAVAVPSAVDYDELFGIARDKAQFSAGYCKGTAFAFECTEKGEDSAGLTFFEIPERYGENIAPHVIGYLTEGKGASGLEYAYEMLLRSGNMENSVTYSTDGFGHILIGEGKSVTRSRKQKTGIVTTLDSSIQKICETAGADIDKGAIVVSDVKNGEILALASFPEYDVQDIAPALDDERSPMINRALYSYSVGSIFKLVTACEGINNDFSGYIYDCTGSCDVFGQNFSCHNKDGHGVQNLTQAMTNSCNPYFISMSRCFDIPEFRSLAFSFGFGREIYLCAGMISSAGVLPTVDELLVPAELANFSFGQGKLTATPLQINQMTCAIANGGELIMLRLIRGVTVDGETVGNEKSLQKSRIMTAETAEMLRNLMISAVYDNDNSNSGSKYARTGAKTSTAQTGRFSEDGEELCNAWVTGFYPADSPKYAITVLVEDGGYGNDSAAPVFSRIVDMMQKR